VVAPSKIAEPDEPVVADVVLPAGRRIEGILILDTKTLERWWASWSGRKPCLDWPSYPDLSGAGVPTCAKGSRG